VTIVTWVLFVGVVMVTAASIKCQFNLSSTIKDFIAKMAMGMQITLVDDGDEYEESDIILFVRFLQFI